MAALIFALPGRRSPSNPFAGTTSALALLVAVGTVAVSLPALADDAQVAIGSDDAPANADNRTSGDDKTATWYSLHIQGTYTSQGHPKFPSAIPNGPQSMLSKRQISETGDATLFAGVRLGDVELYFNPEMDQGYGNSNTFGVAGYVSGEAYKVGEYYPYYRTPRMFGRYVLGLGGEDVKVEDGPNQIAGSHDADNITFTFGKFGVTDIFDNNAYAHDPRADFLNWSLIEMGAFDYAAEAWGYTYGGAVEWNQGSWSWRGGVFDLSRQPNAKYLERGFGQYQAVTEVEKRYEISGNPGKVHLLSYVSSGKMGRYADAITLAEETRTVASTAQVRRHHLKPGGGINIEQQLVPDLGAFFRFSQDDDTKESFDFSDIGQSTSGGLSLKGTRWDRPDDIVAIGFAVNSISKEARRYFADGGTGVVIGDGSLPGYAPEQILESYYKATVVEGLALTVDYQRATNPAYDKVRGPINVFALRIHAEL